MRDGRVLRAGSKERGKDGTIMDGQQRHGQRQGQTYQACTTNLEHEFVMGAWTVSSFDRVPSSTRGTGSGPLGPLDLWGQQTFTPSSLSREEINPAKHLSPSFPAVTACNGRRGCVRAFAWGRKPLCRFAV